MDTKCMETMGSMNMENLTAMMEDEKMLGTVAAGKWVLHPSYVSASVETGKWFDESK